MVGLGLGEKVITLLLDLYYSYHLPLPVRSYCTIPDRVGQADLAWERVPAGRHCQNPLYCASWQFLAGGEYGWLSGRPQPGVQNPCYWEQ